MATGRASGIPCIYHSELKLPSEMMGQRVKELVRRYFMEGIKSSNKLYLGSISNPGQHVFCLVSDAPIPNERLAGFKLLQFMKENRNHLVVDPWLNTSCASGAYIARTFERLQKWHSEGKRISWTGKKGTGWYPAIGEYSTGMRQSDLILTPYT